ncbi:MAG TPA: efflux RND transporter periplasmic adaptor subunit [Thermoguttaceae bacterium]|nr:efflux RND transporter periplasmic adaptor subunit [Thermoguttaceae bacterium]
MNTVKTDRNHRQAESQAILHQRAGATVTDIAPQSRNRLRRLLLGGAAIGLAVIGLATWPWWLSPLLGNAPTPAPLDNGHAASTPVQADAHNHGAAEATGSLQLSPQAQKNIALALVTIATSDFERTVSMPGVLVGRAGRTELTVSAPMTGIVQRVYPIQGEAVAPDAPLFELRLTHEDLVEKQSELLRALEELDVVRREVARLDEVTRSGAVAGKRLLERQYEQQKIEAAIRAQRQGLLLHGLTEEQIEKIAKDRRLLQSVTIRAPQLTDCAACGGHKEVLQVTRLSVAPGRHVATGSPLCTLADHCQLYIEGKAFQQDADVLTKAANEKVSVAAVVEGNGSAKHEVAGLKIQYIENQVDVDSRALRFYLLLPNTIVRDEHTPEGQHFIGWRYRPGQRVEVLVPVERWKNRIVLPVEAVVQEGADWFVYQQVGNRFEQKPVHVEYRDQRRAVIENDGTLFPGDVVAGKGAYQIHLALKNRATPVDPHAGHVH